MVQELSELETLNDNVLRLVMLETVPPEQQHELESLLQRNQSDTLTTEERTRLSELQQAIEYVMLRKARAAVLLRFRGQRIPSLAELRELTLHAQ